MSEMNGCQKDTSKSDFHDGDWLKVVSAALDNLSTLASHKLL